MTGRSTIVVTLEVAAVGVFAGPDVGSGSTLGMGVAVESGTDALSGATVESGEAVSLVDAGDETGRASVGLVTQAKMPSMIAAMGKTSNCDIPDYTQASEWAGRFFRVIWYLT